ncbi:MAG: hypothetical protein KDH19_21090 [Geminicoccaceae bacterium]|nr:hypothetical protein [Geminicoccaceae bacterium]
MAKTVKPERYIWPKNAIAHRIGKSATWINAHWAELQAANFPKKKPLVDGWDIREVDDWLKNLGGENVVNAMDNDADPWA